MNSQKLSAAIRDFTLKARELLLREINEQLEGIYGFLPSGKFEPADRYPAIKSLPEAAENRKRLEQCISDEQATGMPAKEARNKLVLEIAFTRLNRTVALKMMETRGIIRQSVSRGTQSNGYLKWLTRPENEDYYDKYEAGDLPRNSLGEGPRQESYRHYLLWVCAELSKEIKVLFDPDNLSSRIFPRPAALNELIAMMNANGLEEAWQHGNEETIGWVYQFFIEQIKKEVFDRLYKKKEKIRAEDIPAATQLFTPRWVVRCLVENTLGRMWIQMHPDSQLKEKLDYLVPSAESLPKIPLKPVRKIRLLDPACGTMHFGLLTFDLLVLMYHEEIEHAGKPGWPEEPSVKNESEIAPAILAHNLHGIDIDLRAVQLSALTLYLRAKSLNPKIIVKESRLACADIHMLNGDRLKNFLRYSGLEKRPIFRRILSALQQHLQDAEQLGSLLRLDEEISNLVQEERKRFEREGRQLDFFGWSKSQFDTDAGREEFWEILEIQIGQALDAFAREGSKEGLGQKFFADETTKGLRLLEIMGQKYDVVFTNPPYMTARNMNPVLKNYLQKAYPKAKMDLYAAFIQRCVEWLADGGRLGMITQQSFMFISSYENLRNFLREHIAIEIMPHVGPRAFDEISGEKVNTTLLVFRREPDRKIRDDSIGTYFRLVKEPDGETKRRRFEQALACIQNGQSDPVVFNYRQGDFDAIPGGPWVYWIQKKIRQFFNNFYKFGALAPIRQGLSTADNFRFLRFWWEVGLNNLANNCSSAFECEKHKNKWFPFMKGGGHQKWYGNQMYCINYGKNGYELKSWAAPLYGNSGWSRIIKSTEFYFKIGLTWSRISSGDLSVRFSPKGFIFSDAGCCAFPDFKNIYPLLSIINSKMVKILISYLSPTITYEVGHISKIPIPDFNIADFNISLLAEKAISIVKVEATGIEMTYDFIMPPAWIKGIEKLTARHHQLAEIEHRIDEEVYQLYGISDEDRAAIEMELGGTSIFNPGDDDEDEISTANDENDSSQIPSLTPEDLARQWISYAVGMAMGRFQPGTENGIGRGIFSDDINKKLQKLTDPDAILVLDQWHSDDLPEKVLSALSIMLGEKQAYEVVKAAVGKDGPVEELLRNYLERTFFKEHIRQYRKRPVYWLLQSPKKKYGVWLFHEKMNADTLYRIRTEYVAPKINLLEKQINDIRKEYDRTEGKKQRELEKQMAVLNDVLDDIREFQKLLTFISEERGYKPHVNDGVLLNMAPLWELIPSWQEEPKKAWKALERGDYDWAHQAMDHWPDRVREKCLTNKSFAIAHGLEDLYEKD
jgi:hypothetical protein